MELRAGQVAVVTGAASGIGLAMARRFAAEGLRVVLADVEEGALDKAASDLRAEGADVHARVVDHPEGRHLARHACVAATQRLPARRGHLLFLISEQEWVLDPYLCIWRIPNGCGCTGRPRSLRVRRHASCAWSGNAGAGFLVPPGAVSGLGGPMPTTIALVVVGRCRPSPDTVPEGASSDRHGSTVVAGGLAIFRGEGLLPVLGAPAGGVRRIDGHDGDAEFGGHTDEPGAQPGDGHARDELAEPLAAAVLLPGFLGGEVEVFDRNGQVVPCGPVQEPGEGVPYLGVPVVRAAGQS
jgi:hypothetical protein